MLNYKKIEIEIKANSATIWLNQPEIHNALNPSIIGELISIFKHISKKNEIIAIMLRGRGKSFCSGADINWMLDSGLHGSGKSYLDSKKLASCFNIIYQSDKIVFNLIHGNAYGGALGFLGASDFTLAVRNTRFSLPELRLGLIPSVIMPYLLTRVKLPDLKYQIFNGGTFTAEEAQKIGLIDKVFEDVSEMENKANELLQNISLASPKALSETKSLLRTLNKCIINPDIIKETINTITKMKLSDDTRNRMLKFVQKN
jgi:methylglutaconyl-CoA hydratase